MSKWLSIVEWDRNTITNMLKKGLSGYPFTFRGIRIWNGIYIGWIYCRYNNKDNKNENKQTNK
jgi:hypothetical protein